VKSLLRRLFSGGPQRKDGASALNEALYADADAIPPGELSRLRDRVRAFARARTYPQAIADAWAMHAERLYLTFHFLREILQNLPANPVGLECGDASLVTDFLREDFPGVRWSNLAGDLREPWAVEDASVDLILCTEVLEHLNDPPRGFQAEFLQAGLAATLREARRVLKPGGLLFATTPNAASVYHFKRLCNSFSPWFHFPHIREYSVCELVDAFATAGLKLVKCKSVHCMTLHIRDDYTAIFEFLLAQGYSADNRGDDLFLVARWADADSEGV
jgi:SAM-dependent methyltransferase